MRKSLRASVLLLALCCPALAGDMLCPSVAPPNSADEATVQGDISNPPLVEVVLSLLTLL